MDPRTPSFEANLLYGNAHYLDVDLLVEEVRETLEAHGIPLLYAEKVDGAFTLLTCETMQILLAYTDVSLPVDHFLEAHRPALADTDETHVLAKLKSHNTNVTVLVVDYETDGGQRSQWHELQKRTICWEIADCVSQMMPPDLVFWCDTDTLYDFDEFQRACTFTGGSMVKSETLTAASGPYPDSAVITQTTLDWIDAQMVEQVEEARDIPEPVAEQAEYLEMETVVRLTLPNKMAKHLQRMRQSERGARVLRAAAMFWAAAAVGFGSMQNIPTVFF